jgi:hypothetical protein
MGIPPLSHILRFSKPTTVLIPLLKPFANLANIDFFGVEGVDDQLIRFIAQQFPQLRCFSLIPEEHPLEQPAPNDGLIQLARSCNQLRKIGFGRFRFSDQALVEFARCCPHLEDVTLYNISTLTSRGLLEFASSCKQLKTIYLADLEHLNDEALLAFGGNSLKSIKLRYQSNITSQAFITLVSSCPAIETILLPYGDHFADGSLDPLVDNLPVSLKRFEASKCLFSEDAMRILQAKKASGELNLSLW